MFPDAGSLERGNRFCELLASPPAAAGVRGQPGRGLHETLLIRGRCDDHVAPRLDLVHQMRVGQ